MHHGISKQPSPFPFVSSDRCHSKNVSLSPAMKFLRFFRPRKNHRATLLDLHAFGVINVFRRHSILRVWQPQREVFSRDETFAG
jgi:hypothetical protein